MNSKISRKLMVLTITGLMMIPTVAFANDDTQTIKLPPKGDHYAQMQQKWDDKETYKNYNDALKEDQKSFKEERKENRKNFNNALKEERKAFQAERKEDRKNFKDDCKDQIIEKIEFTEVKKEEYRANMTEIIMTNSPDFLDDFEAIWASHDALHVVLADFHRTRYEEMAAPIKTALIEVKAQVDAGTLTKEEAQVQVDTLNAEIQAIKDAYRAERIEIRAYLDDLKATNDVSKETKVALRTALNDAIEADDQVAIDDALEAILASMNTHLQYDQMKVNYLNSL